MKFAQLPVLSEWLGGLAFQTFRKNYFGEDIFQICIADF